MIGEGVRLGEQTVALEALVDPGRPITYGIVQPGPDVPGGVPYVRVVDIKDGRVLAGQLRCTSREIAASYRRSTLKEGDLVISIRGHVGRSAIVPSAAAGANLTQDTARIALAPDADARFVRWYLESPPARRWMAAHTRGVAVTGINLGDLRRVPIPLPPLADQRRIADIIDKADAIRRKRKEAVALTDELLRSAFLEMFGDPVTNPKGWPVQRLDEVSDVSAGVAKGKNYGGQPTVDLPYMRVANVQDGHLLLDDIKTMTVSLVEAPRYFLKPDDVLLTEGGDPDKLGRGAVWHGEIAPCLHQNHIFRVRPSASVTSEFLSAIVGSQRGKRYFLSAAKQTTGIASINMTQLRAFPLLVPPMSLQRRYDEVIASVRRTRERARETERRASHLFASLVHHAFSSGRASGPASQPAQSGLHGLASFAGSSSAAMIRT